MEPIAHQAMGISRPFNENSVVGPTFEDDGGISTVVAPSHVLPQMWMPSSEQITAGHSSLALEISGPQESTHSMLWSFFDSYRSLGPIAGDLARLLRALSADQAHELKDAFIELSKVLPYGELPLVGAVTEVRPAPRHRVESLQAISARAGLHQVHVLPGNLVDFALSCNSVTVRPSREGIVLAFGDHFVVVPPASRMQNDNLLELVKFARRICPTLEVSSGPIEQAVRFAYLLFGYKYHNGIPECMTVEQAFHRCTKLCPEVLSGSGFIPEVLGFADLFRERFLSRRAHCAVAESHVMAAVALGSDAQLPELLRRLCDAQKAIPDPLLGLLRLAKMPRYQLESLLGDAISSGNRTAINPLFDPVSQGPLGAKVARVVEFSMMLHQMDPPDLSEVLIVTGSAGHKTVAVSGLPVRVKQLYAANYGHADVLREITSSALREENVVLDRGFAGDPRYQVSTLADLEGVQGLYADLARALADGSAKRVAMCGPYSAWKHVPDWLAVLAQKYDVTMSRYGMDCSPFFWVHGVRSRVGSNSDTLRNLVTQMHEDLYVRMVLRKTLMLRGQPAIAIEPNPLNLRRRPVYLVQFTGVNIDVTQLVGKKINNVLLTSIWGTDLWKKLTVKASAPAAVGVEARYF